MHTVQQRHLMQLHWTCNVIRSAKPHTPNLTLSHCQHISIVNLWPIMENWARVTNYHYTLNIPLSRIPLNDPAAEERLICCIEGYYIILVFPATCSWSIKDTRSSYFEVIWKYPISLVYIVVFVQISSYMCSSLGKPIRCAVTEFWQEKTKNLSWFRL